MKTTKRILATLLAVIMLAAMMTTGAFAAAAPNSITISGADGHEFTAYQIFTGTQSGLILSDVQWGSGIDSAALLTALQNSTYFDPRFDSCSTASDVAEVLELAGWTEADTDAFAKVVADNLAATSGTGSASGSDYVISGLAPGYYIVIDSTIQITGNDAYSKHIVQAPTNTVIAVKNALPTLTKRVSNSLTDSYREAVSASIGDTVYFALTATMHSRVDEYDTYYLEFVDTLPAGLTYTGLEALVVNNALVTRTDFANYGVTVTASGSEYHIVVDDARKVIKDFTNAEVTSRDELIVVFSAQVNAYAEVNATTGNVNSAVLMFSNDPNIGGGSGSLGTTAAETATVYTYQLIVNKVDSANSALLPGAVFNMYYVDGSGNKQYAKATGDNGAYTMTGWTTEADATTFTTDANGQFVVVGVTAEEYHLKELVAPTGYNLLADEQKVTISATLNLATGAVDSFSANKDGAATTLNGWDEVDGSVTVSIANNQGATLPTTGGIGTTIFYVVGAVLVLGAVTLLVAKKRANG